MRQPALPPIIVRRHGQGGRLLAVLHGGPGAPGSASGLAMALSGCGTVLEPWQRRAGEPALTVEQHVADLAAVLPGPTNVVGWSWGAMLGLSFTVAHPDLVRSLLLVGCGTYDTESRAILDQRMAERLGPAGRAELERVSLELETAEDRDTRDRAFARLGRIAGMAQAYDPITIAGPADVDADGYAQTWADVLERQRNGSEPAAFAGIRCPVLMVHGADDPHPGPATRDLLRRYLPRLEYRELERCGHEPWNERQAREPFLAVVREWLAV